MTTDYTRKISDPNIDPQPIPVSRLKRELNSVMRRLQKSEYDGFLITKKGKPYVYLLKPGYYEAMVNAINDLKEQ